MTLQTYLTRSIFVLNGEIVFTPITTLLQLMFFLAKWFVSPFFSISFASCPCRFPFSPTLFDRCPPSGETWLEELLHVGLWDGDGSGVGKLQEPITLRFSFSWRVSICQKAAKDERIRNTFLCSDTLGVPKRDTFPGWNSIASVVFFLLQPWQLILWRYPTGL